MFQGILIGVLFGGILAGAVYYFLFANKAFRETSAYQARLPRRQMDAGDFPVALLVTYRELNEFIFPLAFHVSDPRGLDVVDVFDAYCTSCKVVLNSEALRQIGVVLQQKTHGDVTTFSDIPDSCPQCGSTIISILFKSLSADEKQRLLRDEYFSELSYVKELCASLPPYDQASGIEMIMYHWLTLASKRGQRPVDPRVLLAPLPPSMEQNVRERWNIKDDERIVGLVDLTLLGTAKDGIVFTSVAIYGFKYLPGRRMSYEEFSVRKIEKGVSGIYVGEKIGERAFFGIGFENKLGLKPLLEIQKSLRELFENPPLRANSLGSDSHKQSNEAGKIR